MLSRMYRNLQRVITLIRYYGPGILWYRLRVRFFDRNQAPLLGSQEALLFDVPLPESIAHHPCFSILVPIYQPNMEYLLEAIRSVFEQSWGSWELCLSDDASLSESQKQVLNEKITRDPRVQFRERASRGGIAQNTQSALAMATGDWVVFLDQDDLLDPGCLSSLAAMIADRSDAEVFYSDEWKIDAAGSLVQYAAKPGWSPQYFCSYMYAGHVVAIKREAVAELNLFCVEVEGSQDYDLILQAMRLEMTIVHIPQALYYWRMHPGSVAENPSQKGYAYQGGIRALKRYAGSKAEVSLGLYPGTYQVRSSAPLPYARLIWDYSRDGTPRIILRGGGLHERGCSRANFSSLPLDISAVLKQVQACAETVLVLQGASVHEWRTGSCARLVQRFWSEDQAALQGLVLNAETRTVLHAGYLCKEGTLYASFRGSSWYGVGYGMRLVTGYDLSALSLQCTVIRKRDLIGCLQTLLHHTLTLFDLEVILSSWLRAHGGSLVLSPQATFGGAKVDFPVRQEISPAARSLDGVTGAMSNDPFFPPQLQSQFPHWPRVD